MKLTLEFGNVVACISHPRQPSTDCPAAAAAARGGGSAAGHGAARRCGAGPAGGAAAATELCSREVALLLLPLSRAHRWRYHVV